MESPRIKGGIVKEKMQDVTRQTGMSEKYDLVIFDMDGTLYKFDKGREKSMFATNFYTEVRNKGVNLISRRLSVTNAEARVILNRVFDDYKGEMSTGLAERYGISKDDYFSSTWNADPSKYMEKDGQLIETLSKVNTKIALLTSAPSIWANLVIEFLGISRFFDGFWYGDYEIRKPNPLAYATVIDSLGAKPEKTVMVDDEIKCLISAKELGLTTILRGKTNDTNADYSIDKIYDVTKIIR